MSGSQIVSKASRNISTRMHVGTVGFMHAQACDDHLMTWKCAASYRRTIWSLLAVMIRVPPVRGWKISMAFVIPLSLVVTRILHNVHSFNHSF